MKLELKHLSPYLNYSLKLKSGDFITEMCASLRYIDDNYHHEFNMIDELVSGGKTWIKPILRPLSDLTKEIEVDGEKFVPLIGLYNMSNENVTLKKLDFEFIDSWGAGKILKVAHTNSKNYTEFIYHKFNFRKETHYEKDNHAFGIDLPHSIKITSEIKNQYFLHEKLFEWHFDVFDLIGAGLAVDINTLK